MKFKVRNNIKRICFLTIVLMALIMINISSCSQDISPEIIGKWELIESIPNPITIEGVAVYLTIRASKRVIIDFDVPDEFVEYLDTIGFAPENLRITGSCSTNNGSVKITVDSNENNAVFDLLANSKFFNRDVQYTIEDNILTLTIDDVYKEVYQRVEEAAE